LLPQEGYQVWLPRQIAAWSPPLPASAGQAVQYLPNPNGNYMGELPSMEKLPETAVNGAIYKITGSSSTGFASYYVRRNGAVWDETVKPGESNGLNANTMPYALVRQEDGSFKFAPFSWAPRRVGDANTNPAPTFIGRTIQDVFFYQNRLAFLVDENAIYSCAGDFGNFWRNTVLDAVTTDVVDVAVTTAQVSKLIHSILFNDGAILFADQTQFSLSNGEDGVTASSVAIRPVTHYQINKDVKPVTVGTEVYFCGNQNGSSVVWEYTRESDTDSTTAAEITAHVPGYLPADLKQLVPLPKGILAITGGPKVYAYQLYWSGNEKIQSAWREWEFGGDVLAGSYVDDEVSLVIRRGDGIYLERLSLAPTWKPSNQPKPVFLDRLTSLSGTYDSVTDRTTFVLPYEPVKSAFRIVGGNGSYIPHALIDPSGYQWVTAVRVTVPGEVPGTVTVGEAYNWAFQFSQQFPKDYQGVNMTTGRLQLRTFTVNYADSAFFRTEVRPYGAALPPEVQDIVPAKLADFTGKVVGAASLRLNTPVYHTGSYSFQVYGESKQATITLTNDTHVGATIVSAEWEAFYQNRSFGK
jgi:hypothetical protein